MNFVNYNRKFIRDYFKKALSLTKLTNKNESWHWGKREQTTFEELWNACLKDSVLKMINTTKLIKIEIDAFDLIIKVCLIQQKESKWHSATYFSRKLSSAEQNYDIHDKKLFAIIAVLKYWRMYAKKTSKLDIYIDHKNLIQFTIIKQLNRRQIRWSQFLKQYKFKIHYTSGKENARANAFNKQCDYMKSKKEFNHNILKINEDGIISTNHHQINATLRIIRDEEKQFLVSKRRFQISKNKIDEYIKKHHNDSLQRHSKVSKTI